jgi:hypothetical protein
MLSKEAKTQRRGGLMKALENRCKIELSLKDNFSKRLRAKRQEGMR